MELIIYLPDEKDLAILEPLLRRMDLRFEKKMFSPRLPSKLLRQKPKRNWKPPAPCC